MTEFFISDAKFNRFNLNKAELEWLNSPPTEEEAKNWSEISRIEDEIIIAEIIKKLKEKEIE